MPLTHLPCVQDTPHLALAASGVLSLPTHIQQERQYHGVQSDHRLVWADLRVATASRLPERTVMGEWPNLFRQPCVPQPTGSAA